MFNQSIHGQLDAGQEESKGVSNFFFFSLFFIYPIFSPLLAAYKSWIEIKEKAKTGWNDLLF